MPTAKLSDIDGHVAAPDAPTAAPQEPSMLQTIGSGLANLGIGAGKGALHTISSLDDWSRQHLPAFMTNQNFGFGPPANLEHVHQMATPEGTMQKIGYGGEQVGEFLLPSGFEKGAAKGIINAVPALKKAAPLVRLGVGALSSGVANKAQGGSFTGGATTGLAGGAAGEGLRYLAPKIAESALNITKADRAFGKTPGKAILEETRGFRPGKIAETGQQRLGELTPQLEAAADRASVRPNPVRGYLPPPAQEIPLAAQTRNPRMRPMAFRAEVNPEEALEPRSGNPMAPISEYPIANPHYLSGGAHPELSGRVPTTQGVLIRPPEVAPFTPPALVPRPSFSMTPAREVVGGAMGKAEAQNAASLHGQLGEMQDFLGQRFGTGEAIPANITPRQGLDLKRGFSKEFLGRWNPETHGDTLAAGRQAYHALDTELDRTVPEAAGLNQRISSLIPVVHRAESTARNAPLAQKIVGRFAAPTGALASSIFGGMEGARAGGVPGAIAGGIGGLVTPLLVGTPEGQMAAARAFNSPVMARTIRALATPGVEQLRRDGNQ